jgi:hypothetical protein
MRFQMFLVKSTLIILCHVNEVSQCFFFYDWNSFKMSSYNLKQKIKYIN